MAAIFPPNVFKRLIINSDQALKFLEEVILLKHYPDKNLWEALPGNLWETPKAEWALAFLPV